MTGNFISQGVGKRLGMKGSRYSRLSTSNVRSDVFRIGIDPRHLFTLHCDHVRELGKDLTQFRDSTFDRFDRGRSRREVLILFTIIS
jgi:hypothetical protein